MVGGTGRHSKLGALVASGFRAQDPYWILHPLSYSGFISVFYSYRALNVAPMIDSFWVGAVPKV